MLLRALESRGELASIAAALVGGAWSVISLLAVPAIALENAGPLAALKRSASIFKDHWSGQIVGMAAIGGVFLFVMLPGLVLAGIGFLVLSESGAAGVGGELLIAAGVVVFAIGAVLASALRQVFAVVLYRWATTGEAPQGFSAEDLRGAVRTRARPPALDRRERRLLKLLGCLAWPRRLAASAPPRAPLGARLSSYWYSRFS